jgi:outer membrane receptor protein involved in Fe transport
MHYFGAYEGLNQSETAIVTSPLVAPGDREVPKGEDGSQYFVKSDNRLNDLQSLSVRYRADKRLTKANGIGGLDTKERGNNTDTLDQDIVGSHTWVASSRALNELRFQYARRSTFSNTEGFSVDGMPEINRPSGRLGKAQNMPQGRDEDRYQLVNNYTYTVGTHDLKAGIDVSFIRANSFFPRNRDGNFQFNTDAPFNANVASTYPIQYTVAIIDPNQPLPNDLYSFFVQDAWRARPNLTFNAGVRYDRERGFHKITGVPDDGDNFQPRLGFVWDPFNTNKTAIRGGYGHYVDQSFLNIQLNVAAARRSSEIVIQNPGYPDPFVPNPFVPSVAANPPLSTADTTPNPKTPETRSVSIGIKREVISGLAVSADYVHSRGHNQYAWDDLNYPDPVTGRRPDPTRGRVIIYDNYGNSWYDALLMSVDKRGARASYGVSYTLSKTMRDVEGFQFTPQDLRDKAADKGYADNDRRHQIVANVTWQLPWDFQVGGIYQARSALPFNPITGTDNNRDTFTNNDRPDFANPDGDPRAASTYFGTFTGRSGNVPRNYARGDAFHNVDVRLSKIVRLQNKRIEGFVEAFNVTNHVNYDRPTNNIRSASFGRATRLVPNSFMRQLEFGVRFDF